MKRCKQYVVIRVLAKRMTQMENLKSTLQLQPNDLVGSLNY